MLATTIQKALLFMLNGCINVCYLLLDWRIFYFDFRLYIGTYKLHDTGVSVKITYHNIHDVAGSVEITAFHLCVLNCSFH